MLGAQAMEAFAVDDVVAYVFAAYAIFKVRQ